MPVNFINLASSVDDWSMCYITQAAGLAKFAAMS
jgi:hypothetical protein